MMSIIDFLVSDEAVMVYVIALMLSVIYIIFYFIKKSSNDRKLRHNTMELKKLSEEVMDVEEKKVNIVSEPVINFIDEEIEKPVLMANMPKVLNNDVEVLEQREAVNTINKDEEVQELIEEILVEEEQQEINNTNNIKYASSIAPNQVEAIKELEEATQKLEENNGVQNIELTEFERIQEDTAIISLEELRRKAKEIYSSNTNAMYEDNGNEPISLKEFQERRVQEENRFKSSPVISPVYGVESNELSLENTANYEKLDEEIRKTNQFINTLKELQKDMN